MLTRVPLWPDCGEFKSAACCAPQWCDVWLATLILLTHFGSVSVAAAVVTLSAVDRHAMPCDAMRCLAAEAVREHLRRRNARLRLRRRGRQAPAVELVPAAAYMGMWVYGSIGNRHHPTPTPYNNNSNNGTSELAGLRSHSIGREVAVVPSIAPNESARTTRKAYGIGFA
jgi:hypothetical protein